MPSGTLHVGCRKIKNCSILEGLRNTSGCLATGQECWGLLLLLLLVLLQSPDDVSAHLGSPDVDLDACRSSLAQNASDKLRSQSLQLHRTMPLVL